MKSVPQISAQEAAGKVRSGDTLVVGGFGMTGHPIHLLHAIAETGVNNLTYLGNNVGEPYLGAGRLLRNGQIRKAIGSFFTSNPEAVAAAQSGSMEVQLIPQGSLGEAIRAGGAGLGGFYTPSAANTILAKDLETRVLDGKDMVFVRPLRGNVALVRAWRADTLGNLQYRRTENNFNQAVATAGDIVIAEVEEIVPAGSMDPDFVHTPGCLVDYLVQATLEPKDLGSSAAIERLDTNSDNTKLRIAKGVLDELRPGEVVNLGIGIPTLVADLITPAHQLTLHTENGMLGVGPSPESGGAMDYPVNAGKIPVTALPGASYFDSTTSFNMIRGGHIDVAVMGALEVDAQGSLANWSIPGKPLLGVGGAMDLSCGAKRVIVTMTHTNKNGESKILPQCQLPLTAKGVVNVIVTELAVFHFTDSGLTLTKIMPGSSLEEIRARTAAPFTVATG